MSSQSVSVSDKYRSALEKVRAEYPDFDDLPTVDLASFANTSITTSIQTHDSAQSQPSK